MALYDDMIGNWSGEYELWFEPGDPINRSATNLTASQQPEGIRVAYNWTFDGSPHAGTYLIDADGAVAFVDSFHTSSSVMECTPNGRVLDVTGTYDAGGQRWGWRTRFEMPSPNELLVTAWNVSPDGDETQATRASYQRV